LEEMTVDYGAMMDDAFGYAKAGVLAKSGRWLKLILATILIGIPLNGWLLRIYRGETPAPEVDRWGSLCIDGFKLFVIGLIYAIPLIILSVIPYLIIPGGMAGMHPQIGQVVQQNAEQIGKMIGLFLLLFVLQLVYDIILAIFMPIAAIRFARTGSFSEAFNFGAITTAIGKIGWLSYILALILIAIVIGIPVGILAVVVLLAGLALGHFLAAFLLLIILILIIAPPLVTFQARYMTQIYNQAEPAKVPAENPAVPAP
jgi:hypothetical protein